MGANAWIARRPTVMVAVLAMVAIAACRSAPSAAGSAGGSNSVLKVGMAQDISSIDPADHAAQNRVLTNQVYEALINLDANGNPQPNLATSWDWGPNDMSITVHLRSGVSFQDGKPFTSADVVYDEKRDEDPKVGNASLISFVP